MRPSSRLPLGRLAGVVLACLTVAPPASAQSLAHSYETWLAVFAHGPLAGDLWLWVDVQPRLYERFEPQAVLLRPGLSWRVTPELFLTAGYAWTPSWSRGSDEERGWGELDFVDEHRSWQQGLYAVTDPASGLAGQVRVRLEQRARTEGDLDVGVRLRVFVRGQVPMTSARDVLVVLWNESFVALNDTRWGQRGGFDQNRLFAGLGWQAIAGQLRLELGYLNRWSVRAGVDPVNHAVALNAFVGWR